MYTAALNYSPGVGHITITAVRALCEIFTPRAFPPENVVAARDTFTCIPALDQEATGSVSQCY